MSTKMTQGLIKEITVRLFVGAFTGCALFYFLLSEDSGLIGFVAVCFLAMGLTEIVMRLFKNSGRGETGSTRKSTEEETRGVNDNHLTLLNDLQIIMLALARLYEFSGVDDDPLTKELYHRGRGTRSNIK